MLKIRLKIDKNQSSLFYNAHNHFFNRIFIGNSIIRTYATVQNPGFYVFDRNAKEMQRGRAALDTNNSRTCDYLKNEMANRMVERLALIKRDLSKVLDLGSGAGSIEKAMCTPQINNEDEVVRSRIGEITMMELSKDLLYRDSDAKIFDFNKELNIKRVVLDEEVGLSRYPDNSFTAVLSNLSLHWINDLPNVLKEIERILVPDGLFMCNMFGGDTLFELRTAIQLAEMERLGGMSPRISPFAEATDIVNLLQRAKFSLNTVDVDEIIVDYPDMFALMKDLQYMGESNAIHSRQASIPRDVLLAASAIYPAMHSEQDGRIPATFRVINAIGWKYSSSQQKPIARGTGEVNISEMFSNMKDKKMPESSDKNDNKEK